MPITLTPVTVPTATLEFTENRLIIGDDDEVVTKMSGYMTKLEAWSGQNVTAWEDFNDFIVELIAALESLDATVSQATIDAMQVEIDSLKANTFQPAGVGNTSRHVWETIGLYDFQFVANGDASAADLEVLPSDVTNAVGIWNLMGSGISRPFKTEIAHLYTDYVEVYVQSTNGRRYYALLPGATLIQKQNNPSDTLVDTAKWLEQEGRRVEVSAAATEIANIAPAVISGAGYKGRMLTKTSGTWDTDVAVTGEWYANGVATGTTGSSYTIPTSKHGQSFYYKETSGAVTRNSNTIQNWIPNSLNPVLWSEHTDPDMVLSGTNVTTFPNKGSASQDCVVLSGRANPVLSGGVLTSYAGTDYVDLSPAPTVGEVYFVAQYKDGLDTTFDDYATIAYGAKRIMGQQGNYTLFNGSAFGTDAVFKNGSTSSTTSILPLPMTLMRFAYSSPSTVVGYMAGGIDGRGWDGAIRSFMGFASVQTLANRQKIEGYLAWSTSTESLLVSGHPYRSTAPGF